MELNIYHNEKLIHYPQQINPIARINHFTDFLYLKLLALISGRPKHFCIVFLIWLMPCLMLYNHYSSLSNSATWRDQSFCLIDCKVGTPCQYKDEVDFRIIVMTYNRADSLRNCLTAIGEVHTMGMRVSVEIWIDSKATDREDADPVTVEVAHNFTESWSKGRACVHKREKNAYIDGQWIDSWRPREGSKEIALILEDDVDIAHQALRWLKLVHGRYGTTDNIAGYTLQMENTKFYAGKKGKLVGPKTDSVFLYGVLGTWGFSPTPESWRGFQDWFHSKDPNLKPYVPGIVPTRWYQSSEKRGTQRSMWEMWHIYYTYINKHLTMYCNLRHQLGKENIQLSSNRKEKGLHYHKGNSGKSLVRWNVMMDKWGDAYEKLPDKVVRYTYDGVQTPQWAK